MSNDRRGLFGHSIKYKGNDIQNIATFLPAAILKTLPRYFDITPKVFLEGNGELNMGQCLFLK